MFSLQDDDEQWMSLRYDLTAPLARHFAENFERLPKPYRSYRQGWVFRNEKPGPGRFRQFMQFDADTVGAAGPEADAEMCMMMADTMDALGLAGKYVVKVNNRKVLDGVLDSARGCRATSRSSLCCAPSTSSTSSGSRASRLLLGAGRKDESGDFTKGAGLTATSRSSSSCSASPYDINAQPTALVRLRSGSADRPDVVATQEADAIETALCRRSRRC